MIKTFGYGNGSREMCGHIDEYVEKIIKTLTDEFGSKYASVIRERLNNALYIFARRDIGLRMPLDDWEYREKCLAAKKIGVNAILGHRLGIGDLIIKNFDRVAGEEGREIDLSQVIEMAEEIERDGDKKRGLKQRFARQLLGFSESDQDYSYVKKETNESFKEFVRAIKEDDLVHTLRLYKDTIRSRTMQQMAWHWGGETYALPEEENEYESLMTELESELPVLIVRCDRNILEPEDEGEKRPSIIFLRSEDIVDSEFLRTTYKTPEEEREAAFALLRDAYQEMREGRAEKIDKLFSPPSEADVDILLQIKKDVLKFSKPPEKGYISHTMSYAHELQREREGVTESLKGLSVPQEWESSCSSQDVREALSQFIFARVGVEAFCDIHINGSVVYFPVDVVDSVLLHECIHATTGWHQSGGRMCRGFCELAEGMVDGRKNYWWAGSGLEESFTEYHAQRAARKADTIATKVGNYVARAYYDLTYELLPFFREFDSELARSYIGGEAPSKFFGPQYVEFLKAADDVLDYNAKHRMMVNEQCAHAPLDQVEIEAVRLHSHLQSLMEQVSLYARDHGYGAYLSYMK